MVQVARKMLTIPLLNEELTNTWQVTLGQELNMTNDSDLFQTYSTPGCLPVYEGKMIWQFETSICYAALIGLMKMRGESVW